MGKPIGFLPGKAASWQRADSRKNRGRCRILSLLLFLSGDQNTPYKHRKERRTDNVHIDSSSKWSIPITLTLNGKYVGMEQTWLLFVCHPMRKIVCHPMRKEVETFIRQGGPSLFFLKKKEEVLNRDEKQMIFNNRIAFCPDNLPDQNLSLPGLCVCWWIWTSLSPYKRQAVSMKGVTRS